MLFVQMCRHGQVVKTLASHAEIRGSTPLGDTNEKIGYRQVSYFYLCTKQKRRRTESMGLGEGRFMPFVDV